MKRYEVACDTSRALSDHRKVVLDVRRAVAGLALREMLVKVVEPWFVSVAVADNDLVSRHFYPRCGVEN